MTFWTLLRAIALVAMAYGAWANFRKAPRGFTFEGRTYYPLPDGRFCTRWGRIITDPALHARLAQHRAKTETTPGLRE